MEMVIAFEEEFDVEIPDDAGSNILTVHDAVDYIMRAQAGRPAGGADR
jgi:acyl carrier protein